ncbi:hypothetical protein PFNF54_00332 [Plasmodium falciparum NF54]|uniref:Uncharacterized protein n=1 Tax=Plasmodium falciparum (isolate NF54) TaxID=5843 RepID=W7KD22_PLAFO|nr:hypothetical protein PFNF54_00332 [Plasmodium falciparum NF54]
MIIIIYVRRLIVTYYYTLTFHSMFVSKLNWEPCYNCIFHNRLTSLLMYNSKLKKYFNSIFFKKIKTFDIVGIYFD